MKKILRITTVSHSLDLLLKGQLKYIGDRGFDIHIACTFDERIPIIQERENVKFHKLSLTRVINPMKDFIALYKTIKIIKQVKPDIVHTHSPKAGIIGMIASYICKVPLKVHTVAGLPLVETKGGKRLILIWVERLTYFCADYVLPNSLNQKAFIKKYISRNKKIQIIGKGSSNGINLDYYDPSLYKSEHKESFRKEYGIDVNDIVFCFVGRLTNYKGINELIESFTYIQKKYNNVKLLLVGPFEELNPLLSSNKNEIESNPNILHVGHQEDIRPYLSIADIFVFPSYREGFPQSLMQAAAMNLPCIATNINGCNEIIKDQVSGILVPVKNSKSLSNAMERLINDHNLRTTLAQSARKNIIDFYEQKHLWDQIINFYHSKLNNKKIYK